MELRDMRGEVTEHREAFKKELKEKLKVAGKKPGDLRKFIVSKTEYSEPTLRSLFSIVQINDELMRYIEDFFGECGDAKSN